MMKYLKAEAEIIKFDNSDVVTQSDCGTTAENEFEDTGIQCGFWSGFVRWVIRCWWGGGWTINRNSANEASTDTYAESADADWL